jgi:hypothetical protein
VANGVDKAIHLRYYPAMLAITRAISIRQPFVEQILRGTKRYEYRSVPTNIRERVYVYASLKPRTEKELWRGMGTTPHRLPKGVIVGTVEIIDCKPASFGGYKYKLANPKRLRKHLVAKNQPNPLWWRPQFK